MSVVGSLEVSEAGGLGQIDVHRRTAAVVLRDEGVVALVDISNPSQPRVLGRYEDQVSEALDGDVAFSDDGEWLFFARQTSNFDEDGVHVLDLADKSAPTLASYQPGGGAFRVEYYEDEAGEWVVLLDAVDGLVVFRFVRETGTLVKVFEDPQPALDRVGGPASAGIFIAKKDPQTKMPLLYVAGGNTGLQIYDFSDPTAPVLLGEWGDAGLADIDVRATMSRRVVYAATEYWFDKSTRPGVVVLDATDLANITKTATRSFGFPADDLWRVQGIDVGRKGLFVANSHAGVIRLKGNKPIARASLSSPHNDGAGYNASPYSMDVVLDPRGYALVSDASSGRLHVIGPRVSGAWGRGF